MRRLHRASRRRPRALTPADVPLQRDERVLVVWAHSLDEIIPTCRDFEDKLIKLVWNQRSTLASATVSVAPSSAGSDVNLTEKETAVVNEKEVAAAVKEKEQSSKREKDKKKKKSGFSLGLGYFVSAKEDVEKNADGPSVRPQRLLAPIYCGLACALSFCKYYLPRLSSRELNNAADFVGSGTSVLVVEWVLDGSATRFALLVTAPLLFCISLVSPTTSCHTTLSDTTFDSSSAPSSSVISAWCKPFHLMT